MFELIMLATDPATLRDVRRFAGHFRSLTYCEAAGRTRVEQPATYPNHAFIERWRYRYECREVADPIAPQKTADLTGSRTDLRLVIVRFVNGVVHVERLPLLYPDARACVAAGNDARARHVASVKAGTTPTSTVLAFRCENFRSTPA